MSTNAELIKALRCCGVECKCYGCPYENKTGINEKSKCIHMVLSDAADAIERLTEERKQIKDKLIRLICSHCVSVLVGCEGCPVIGEVRAVFDERTDSV